MTAPSCPDAPGHQETTQLPVLAAERVSQVFSTGFGPWRRTTTALDAVSLRVQRGGAHAIVGQSGSGKSTLLRILLGGTACTTGQVKCFGRPVTPKTALKWFRMLVQCVPQDPGGSLNPTMTIGDCVAEPLRCLKMPGNHSKQVCEALAMMSIPAQWRNRLPAQLSGGQRQRVAIARAMVVRPAVLAADEPTSALDAGLRLRVLDALHQARTETGCALVLVTHDIAAVRYSCDQVTVLHQGQVAETGSVDTVFDSPTAEATQKLIAAQFQLPPAMEPP